MWKVSESRDDSILSQTTLFQQIILTRRKKNSIFSTNNFHKENTSFEPFR